jgi:hypothetical protein
MLAFRPALIVATVLVGLQAGQALAQQPPPGTIGGPSANPLCIRLESDLARIDRGDDSGRQAEIDRVEGQIARQQQEIDRTTNQWRRMGCEQRGGFFLFGGAQRPPQCDQLDMTIGRLRQGLDQLQAQNQRLNGSGSNRDSMRRQILIALATNRCGPQYRIVRTETTRPRNFLETLFGAPGETTEEIDVVEVPRVSSFRTVCVRTCDGAFFPISWSTTQSRFRDDEQLCQRLCPASEAQLFAYRSQGEDIEKATSISGRPYTALPNAFRFRTEFNPACSCKRADQTWADALGHLEDRTVQRGDIVVTEEKARQMSQPGAARPDARQPRTAQANARPGPAPLPVVEAPAPPPEPAIVDTDPANRTVRVIGPQFYPVR